MSDDSKQARPLFRKLAGGVALVCAVFAIVFRFARPEDGLFGPVVCLVVAFIMALIAAGRWPGR